SRYIFTLLWKLPPVVRGSSSVVCGGQNQLPGVAGQVESVSFGVDLFFFSGRRRHTRSVSAFLLNRSSDLLFLLVLILLLMPTLNFLPVWFALSLLRFRLPSRLPMMFILWMVAMMVVIIPSRTV